MPAFWENIAKTRLCDLQVMPGARIARLRGHKIFGGHEKFNTLNPRAWTKKKVSISKYARIFTNSGVKPQKKDLYYKICKKTVLAHKLWGDNQYLGSLRPRTALQWRQASYFLWVQSSLGGHSFCLWGTSSDLGGTAPERPPWRRACCKFTAIYRTVIIAFSLKRYCSKSVLLKK